MYSRQFLFLLFLSLTYTSSFAQKANFFSRYINRLVNDTTEISRPQFLIYPTLAYSPETSWEFGLSSLYVFYAKRDTANRLSEINGFTFVTLENQYGIWLDHALYSNRNEWFVLGRLRFQSFPLLYYGIGPKTSSDYIARVDGVQVQIKERVLRKLRKNLFLGIEVDFQSLGSVDFISRSDVPIIEPLGSEGSSNLAFGTGVIFDNRHNILNVRDGFFSELAFLRYDRTWGSSYTFNTVISDTRLYKAINSRDVFAAQLLGQFNSDNTPFNQLALMGGETMMRGYYTGRYRDDNQIAAQVEYRFLPLPLGFTNRFGAALFTSTAAVFDEFRSLDSKNFVWSGGAGIRFLLFPKKDIYTRFDVAFTKEGNGFYIFIGEAF